MLYLIKPLKDGQLKPKLCHFSKGLHPETLAGLQTGYLLTAQNGTCVGASCRTTQTSTLLSEPAGPLAESANALMQKAHASETNPLFYKCHKRSAATLRKHGFATIRIAQDALINLTTFDVKTPKYKGLRRKLRKAETAGVTIHHAQISDAEMQQMAVIDADWQGANGTARGLSMGRFSSDYVMSQVVFTAWQDKTMIAFITCHQSPECWTLDIMRSATNAPDGTMYALVHQALIAAKEQHCERFSLASTSYEKQYILRFIDQISLRNRTRTAGLEQFKRSFAPAWQPLYAAAPSNIGLTLSLWDVWQEIHDPPPIPEKVQIAPCS